MNNLQAILVGSIPFVAAALLACGRRIPWTDRYGWIGAAAITWALLVGWIWHLGDAPPAPILAPSSIAIGAVTGWLVGKGCTAGAAPPSRARPEASSRGLGSSRRQSAWTPNRARAEQHRVASRGQRRSSHTKWVIALFAATAASRGAQSQPTAETEEKSFLDRRSFVLDFDVVSAYYFRGIPQENQGFIGEPYLTISYTAFESESWLSNLTFSVTSWNSLQTGPTGSGGQHRSPEVWYESDIVASVSATVFEKWTASTAIYTAYTSPNGSYDTVQEIALKLSYDDTKALGDFALHPYALIAFEFDDQADGGNTAFNPIAPTSEGIYLELGIAPTIPLIKNEKTPVSLSIPVTAGFSLDDYYENGSGGNRGSQFGFVDVGFEFNLPIASIMPSGMGVWALKAGPHLIWLGDALAALGQGITGGNHFDVWWKLSISVTF